MENINLENSESPKDEIDLREIINSLLRRKKYFFLTGSLVFLILSSLAIKDRILRPIYRGSFAILISDPMNRENNVRRSSGGVELFEELARNTTNNDLPTLIQLLKSELLLNPIAISENIPYKSLAAKIKIKPAEPKEKVRLRRLQLAEGILRVELLTKNPKKGLRLLNSLRSTYLRASLDQRQKRLNDGLEFLNEQEPILQNKTNLLESKIVKFREKYNLLEPQQEGLSIKNKQTLLNDKLSKLQYQEKSLIDVKEEIINGSLSAKGFQDFITVDINDKRGLQVSEFDQSLLEELLLVENELAKARSKYTESSNIVLGLNSRLQKIRPLLLKSQIAAVNSAINLNKNEIKNTTEQLETLTNLFRKQPALIKEYNLIQQKLKLAQENYVALESARENLQLQIAQSSVPWRIIEEPNVMRRPIKPRLKRRFAYAFIYSIIAGLFVAYLRDRFDHVYHYPEEVKNSLKTTLLGHSPFVEEFESLVENKRQILNPLNLEDLGLEGRKKIMKQRFFYQEAYRNIYTSIRYLNIDKPVNALSITSSIPSEGKSLVTVLLAMTYAEIGKKVLIIDTDLRKPQLHFRLGLNNLKGLSNLIIEKESKFEEFISKTPQNDNLDFIPAGIKPPDAPRLLNSERMRNIHKDILNSKKYDLVIYDTPPTLGLADSLLISDFLDGTILVVSINKVDRSLPKETIQRIKSAPNINLLGLITNSTNSQGNSKISGYGNYGYGYNKNYGYNNYSYLDSYSSNELEEEDKLIVEKNESLPTNSKIKSNFIDFISLSIKKFKVLSNKFLSWLDN